MVELLETYSITEIFIFVFMLAFAIKGVMTLFDYFKDKLSKYFNKERDDKENQENVAAQLKEQAKEIEEIKKHTQEDLCEIRNQLKEHLDKSHEIMSLLLQSDRDDIKAWITEKHHYFCYEKKYIDDYSLDCMEKRFKHYEDEGGNSFVSHLMDEVRALPRVLMTTPENKKEK